MRLNTATDYALRVLIYCGRSEDDLCTAQMIAESFNITHSNTSKVVNALTKKGYLQGQRGRYGGGIKLARLAEEIRLGDVIRDIEPDMELVQCFNRERNTCPAMGDCALAQVLHEGLAAMIAKMNEKTLADIL